ncbi:MAG: hypothetical protein LBQ87_06490 [Candidatus Fibromonas sp.]|jgi:uncharacterized protein (TIGR02145 family)|nr:hypothetical protein [Candidatus Fibromonas sp.]
MAENMNHEAEGGKCYGEGGKVEIGGGSGSNFHFMELPFPLAMLWAFYKDFLDDWVDLIIPSYRILWVREVQANCKKYGRLYDWETAMKICPKGWRLPNNDDWRKLLLFVDYDADKLKATSGWKDGNGTDDYGFSALPGGMGLYDLTYKEAGYEGNWYSASEFHENGNKAHQLEMNFLSHANLEDGGKYGLYSVRCIQGQEPTVPLPPPLLTTDTLQYGGKTYKTVQIGTQTWMAENMNQEAEGSVCYGEDGGVKKDDAEAEYEAEYEKLKLSSGNIQAHWGALEKTYKKISDDEVQANCEKYGRLYSWENAMKICPKGWHLPNDTEWDKLFRFVDGDTSSRKPYESPVAAKLLKATSGWNSYKESDGNGTDDYGFSALPGGYGNPNRIGIYNIRFENAGNYGYWWSAFDDGRNYDFFTYLRGMSYFSDYAGRGKAVNSNLRSVRCVRD